MSRLLYSEKSLYNRADELERNWREEKFKVTELLQTLFFVSTPGHEDGESSTDHFMADQVRSQNERAIFDCREMFNAENMQHSSNVHFQNVMSQNVNELMSVPIRPSNMQAPAIGRYHAPIENYRTNPIVGYRAPPIDKYGATSFGNRGESEVFGKGARLCKPKTNQDL